MAITIRVPDPAEKYEVGNQRQIVRAINNVIQQLNAQYKPDGETFAEIEQLSYFLGYAPSTPSGPDAGAGGGGNALSWQQANAFPATTTPGVANIGYIFNNAGFPDPTTLSLPAAPTGGTQIGALITSNTFAGGDFVNIGSAADTIDGAPGPVQIGFGFAGDKRVLVYDQVTSGWWTLIN